MTWRCTFAMGRLALPIADPGVFPYGIIYIEGLAHPPPMKPSNACKAQLCFYQSLINGQLAVALTLLSIFVSHLLFQSV